MEYGGISLLLPVANFPQMNFTQMHEHLRLELLRRIQRGTLSVSLLARQTGFGQAHLSNFLHRRRQLSLEALDRILASQRLGAGDLIPVTMRTVEVDRNGDCSAVPVVSHAAALFEPVIRPSAVQTMLHLPPGVLKSLAHARARRTACLAAVCGCAHCLSGRAADGAARASRVDCARRPPL